jgi:hypothetical protein
VTAPDETQSSAPMPNSRLRSAEGHVCRTPDTCARARPLGRTSASPRRSHPVGRGSRRRPPARPRPRAAWGTPARCRSRARLGLKDRVADRTYDATVRQSANPPDPTLFVRPGTRSLVEMPICRHFDAYRLGHGIGPRREPHRLMRQRNLPICRHFKKRERRDSNPRPRRDRPAIDERVRRSSSVAAAR